MNISNELIQKLIDVQAAYAAKEAIAIPDDAPRFEIDMNTRAITVPTGRTVLAVRNDHCAEIVCFELDRYYKGHDLSTETCVVQYAVASRRGGQYINEGFYPVTMIDLSTEGKLLFAWEIKNSVTNTSGIVDFSVRFYSIDSSGEKPEFEYNANTLISSMVIKNTLDVANEGVSFEPGEVESLTDKFEDLAKAAADSASNANKAAATIIGTLDTVKEYADAVEQNSWLLTLLPLKPLHLPRMHLMQNRVLLPQRIPLRNPLIKPLNSSIISRPSIQNLYLILMKPSPLPYRPLIQQNRKLPRKYLILQLMQFKPPRMQNKARIWLRRF